MAEGFTDLSIISKLPLDHEAGKKRVENK